MSQGGVSQDSSKTSSGRETVLKLEMSTAKEESTGILKVKSELKFLQWDLDFASPNLQYARIVLR